MAKKKQKLWVVVGDSVMGLNHVKNNIPCQDSHLYEEMENGWGIAIVADGAGSADYSHQGSQFVVKEGMSLFKKIVTENKWTTSKKLPEQAKWHKLAKTNLKQLRNMLAKEAEQTKKELGQLASTIMVAIFSPLGILCTHIGDGRGGYSNSEGEWKPLFTPWKGEYANETIFLTSDIWADKEVDKFVESKVINEKPFAFTLMSDGLEMHSFECSVWDEKEEKYYDPNRPYQKFFNPVVNGLVQMKQSRMTDDEIKGKWNKFLREGNEKIKNEPDDKTMIIGAYFPNGTS
ncbi:PP2C family serine/threonine-protein phosphatase [Microscilla marina]|uniref:PPM-type phosphatase domain-containing protein n=1 Tax=Microscilla marina ATCC 23134 TaxID=313606 RepID=A1ZP74_MICM2|nr:PP2C family serine/threonine-protein phosphatase [Microscilla marina]EAY27866.1 conserved hypothetical protein [Microscilla marina ATCC 23134]